MSQLFRGWRVIVETAAECVERRNGRRDDRLAGGVSDHCSIMRVSAGDEGLV